MKKNVKLSLKLFFIYKYISTIFFYFYNLFLILNSLKKKKESKYLKTPIEKRVKTSQKRAKISCTRFHALFFFFLNGGWSFDYYYYYFLLLKREKGRVFFFYFLLEFKESKEQYLASGAILFWDLSLFIQDLWGLLHRMEWEGKSSLWPLPFWVLGGFKITRTLLIYLSICN